MASRSIHQFAEKVAVVSDISHPLGRAAALQLALLGAFVIAGERTEADGDTIAEMIELGTLAGSAKIAGDEKDGEKLAAAAGQSFGRIDLLLVCENIGGDAGETFAHAEGISGTPNYGVFARAEEIIAAAEPLMSQRPKPKIVRCFSTHDFPDELRRVVNAAAREHSETSAANFDAKFRANTMVVHEDKAGTQGGGVLELRPRSSVAWDDAARVAVYLLSSEATSLNGQCLVIK